MIADNALAFAGHIGHYLLGVSISKRLSFWANIKIYVYIIIIMLMILQSV